MHLKALYLRNFRNYEEAEINFGPQLNVFYGDNAQGKTNLLEAIYFIATGRSFKTLHLHELIRAGESFFYLEALLFRDGVSQTVKLSFDGQVKKLQMDANSFSSFHPLLGVLPAILYTPQDIELIIGSPAERRRFYNLHLAQSDPLYVHHLSRFWHSMKQRNCLLRSKIKDAIDCWEVEMAQSAAYLIRARHEMTEELREPLQKMSLHLSNEKETHELRFLPSASGQYLQQLQKNRSRETELGVTLTGPHRDDLSLLIEGKAARIFASEGQKKTAIAALRLAEWSRLSHRIQGKPLLGIDDLGLHLDETRQKLLRASLENLGQVFITTPTLAPHWEQGKSFHIQNGKIKKD